MGCLSYMFNAYVRMCLQLSNQNIVVENAMQIHFTLFKMTVYILQIQFDGLSGHIQFDADGHRDNFSIILTESSGYEHFQVILN